MSVRENSAAALATHDRVTAKDVAREQFRKSPDGLTDYELWGKMKIRIPTISEGTARCRRCDLEKEGFVTDSHLPNRQHGVSRCDMTVWTLKSRTGSLI